MTAEGFRYQEVAEHVRSLIDSKALTPGTRLPSLRDLSRRLRVSIATVSQAYLELEKTGIIEARTRSGFFVRTQMRQLAPAKRPQNPALQAIKGSRSLLIQEVLQAVGNHDFLPLGVICPDPSLLPSRDLARLLAMVSRNQPQLSLGYESVAGNLDLRRQIAILSLSAGFSVRPEEIIVTCGAMEALYIAIRSVTRPGDNVLIQSPTYFCFLQLLENCGLRAIEIPSYPETGIDPADLAKALKTFDVAACILAPNFNNPDGSLTPDSIKEEIVQLLAERNIPLVEDDVSGELYFGQQRPGTYKSFDRKGMVIYCSSFSKTICPGYRIGWMIPGQTYPKALEIKSTTNVSCATPTQMAVAEYLQGGLYDRHLRRLRHALQQQMQTMQIHLSNAFPDGTRSTRPRGGSVLWLELPGKCDAVEFFYRARAEGISIAPGPIFSTQDRYDHFIRLSCSGVWSEALGEGVTTLGQIAKDMA